jgi:potassium/hydrogen antiporter
MSELFEFGRIVLLVTAGFSLALASDLFPALADHTSIRQVERIGVVALIAILFGGGCKVGWRRFRASAVEIAFLGVFGTVATAGLMALAAHSLFGFSWTSAGVLGAALAPTDRPVLFSVLGNREFGGHTGTILEGTSGANDSRREPAGSNPVYAG